MTPEPYSSATFSSETRLRDCQPPVGSRFDTEQNLLHRHPSPLRQRTCSMGDGVQSPQVTLSIRAARCSCGLQMAATQSFKLQPTRARSGDLQSLCARFHCVSRHCRECQTGEQEFRIEFLHNFLCLEETQTEGCRKYKQGERRR